MAGRRLTGVALQLIDDEVSTIEVAGRIVVCEADLGVLLEFDNGPATVVRWGTPGVGEGIFVEDAGPDSEGSIVRSVSDIVVASCAGSLGERIARVEAIDAQFDWAERTAPWAISIALDGGLKFAVALGEIGGAEVTYSPDSLALILDEETGRAYQVPGAEGPAWFSDEQ